MTRDRRHVIFTVRQAYR